MHFSPFRRFLTDAHKYGTVWRRTMLTASKPSLSSMLLQCSEPFEEESLPKYHRNKFYPAKIGEILKRRYEIVGKLGFGSYSTVWLCHDRKESSYKTLKICSAIDERPDTPEQEDEIYKHISTVTSRHPGQFQIRKLFDSFKLPGAAGKHLCLLHPPMFVSIAEIMQTMKGPIGIGYLKIVFKRVLQALDFLHTEAGVVHGDLKSQNIMTSMDDQETLAQFHMTEQQSPSPRKIVDDSLSIFASRSLVYPKKMGTPTLCDFGHASIGTANPWEGHVQVSIYRAPEVILKLPWGPAIDIWNLGCLAWYLVEGRHLFEDILTGEGKYDECLHLSKLVAVIGSPPPAFQDRDPVVKLRSQPDGKSLFEEPAQTANASLQSRAKRVDDSERSGFIKFVSSMLHWEPQKRKTATELLADPWLSMIP